MIVEEVEVEGLHNCHEELEGGLSCGEELEGPFRCDGERWGKLCWEAQQTEIGYLCKIQYSM